ncbi:hypothetical protein AB2B38_006655 [Balneola sp. MJW-20]|uniref:hypothetical protein n=1 Tax=Gracilimonas aurantiaca TaxID=3234185 RepID=UPI003466C714
MKTVLPFILLFSLLLNACSEPDQPVFDWSAVPTDTLKDLSPIITFDDHQIANPRDINILSSGNFLVLDYSSNKYHILSPDLETLYVFGGEGEGPGEFLSPRQVTEIDGNIFITDNNSTRISRLDLQGEFLGSFLYETSAVERDAAGLGDQEYVSVTNGADGSLFKYSDLDDGVSIHFGFVPGGAYSFPDIEKGARQLKAREIPDFMKNNVLLMADEDHIYSHYLALSMQLVYDHDGMQTDSFKVHLPYLNELFAMYREQADASSADRGFPILPVIEYIWDMYITPDSYWYLTKATMKIPQQVVRYNKMGEPVHVYEIPRTEYYKGIVQLAVDEKRGKLYLVNYSNGRIFGAEI